MTNPGSAKKPRQKVADLVDQTSFYRVNFKISERTLIDGPENEDLIHDFTGQIVHRSEQEEEEGGKGAVVGKVWGARLDVGGALDRKCSLFDVCDGRSQELYDYYEALFNTTTDEYLEQFALGSFGDLLIVYGVEIDQKHRGLNLGLLAMLQAIRVFGGGCALAAIKPFPLQFSSNVTEKNKLEFLRAQKKLRAYWTRLGFAQVGETDYYYVDPTCVLPDPQAILGGEVGKMNRTMTV